MQLVKQQLLAALAGELDILSPGAGARAAFESPKVAEHGDFACTAAMQLAKVLKLNPRALGETVRDKLLATPAFAQWVSAIEIAGPGFINIRLKPQAKQETVREILRAGAGYGVQASTDSKSATMRSEVATGRRMKIRETFMGSGRRGFPRCRSVQIILDNIFLLCHTGATPTLGDRSAAVLIGEGGGARTGLALRGQFKPGAGHATAPCRWQRGAKPEKVLCWTPCA